jgi:hypothetical protein
MLAHAARLKEALETARGQSCDVRIVSRPPRPIVVEVDPPLPADAAVIAAFDWSDEAHAAWQEGQRPERKTFRQRFQAAVTRLQEIEGATTLTNAQQTTAINDIARIQLFALRAIKELND